MGDAAEDAIRRAEREYEEEGGTYLPQPRGRVVHETDLEAHMTDMYAKQIEDQSNTNMFFLRKVVSAVRTLDRVGWDKRAIIVEFEDGSAIRISGVELQVKEYPVSPSDEQAFEEINRG